MNYTQTLDYLYQSLTSFQQHGASAYKPGLERITAFMKQLGNPQRNYFTIHVAGTNGKGSVAHMLAATLQQAGYRTGLFTSPHMNDFRERIRVDGEMIPKQKVVNFVDKHREAMDQIGLSFFEMSTALAFDYFDQSDVEVAVIETGLGGRLDATNLLVPLVSVVTNVGLDHTDLLGDTVEQIAGEKAGIVKKSIPLILGEADPRYNALFEEAVARNKSRVIYAEQSFSAERKGVHDQRQYFSVRRLRDGRLFEIGIDLLGDYQIRNLITACTVIDFLHEETPLTISRRALLDGMCDAAAITGLQGRWQTLAAEPLTVCDTGHNEPGIRSVVEQLGRCSYRRLYCVFGMMRDKDRSAILALLPRDALYLFAHANSPRALPSDELCAEAARYGLQGEACGAVADALARARQLAGGEDMIFIGGSTYVVAEALN